MQPWFTTPLDGRRSLLPRSCCRVCSRPGCSRRALNIECRGPFRNGATREKPSLQRRWICCSRKNILESFIALEFFFCFWGERTCRRIDNFPRAASRNRGTLFIFRRGCARCSTHNAIFQNHNSLLFADDWKEKQIGDSFSSREGWHEGYSRIYRCIATQLLFIGSRSLFIEAARARSLAKKMRESRPSDTCPRINRARAHGGKTGTVMQMGRGRTRSIDTLRVYSSVLGSLDKHVLFPHPRKPAPG